MKILLLCTLAAWAALSALLAQTAAPTPAPPVSAPQPGMAWEIEIRPAPPRAKPDAATDPQSDPAPAPAQSIRIAGRCGPDSAAWTVQFPGGNRRDFLLTGNRLFAWNEKTGKLSMPELRDGRHDEALAFEVSGLPGIGWVKNNLEATVAMDPRDRSWRATYLQEARPFKIINEGTEDEYAEPTGPSVRVQALFDAATGLPIQARVDNKIYVYKITNDGAGHPDVSPGFRRALDARLQREAALLETIRRQEAK